MFWRATTIALSLAACAFSQVTPNARPTTAAPATQSTQQAYAISGLVVDMITGEPLPDTEVTVIRVPERVNSTKTVSDDEGKFRIAGLGRGKYQLLASRKGYSLQGFEEHEELATAIVTGPDLDSENILFRIQPDAVIRGTVSDDGQEPISRVSVMLFRQDTTTGERRVHMVRQANVNDRGEFSIGRIGAGTYYLAAQAHPWFEQFVRQMWAPGETSQAAKEKTAELDMAYPLTFYPDETESGSARPITVQPGQKITADITLHAVRSLHVRVPADPEKQVIGSDTPTQPTRFRTALAHQRVFDTELPIAENISTQPDGSLEVQGLAPGQYTIEVSEASTNGELEQTRRVEMNLQRDSDLNDGAARANRTVVDGEVLLDEQTKARTPVVQLFGGGHSYWAPVEKKDKNLTFRLPQAIEAGKYEVLVHNTNSLYLERVTAKGATVSGHSVTIGNDANVHLTLTLSKGLGRVDGFAMRDNKPCVAAMVVLVPETPGGNLALFRRDQSDSDGSFTLPNIVPGRYRVIALQNAWDLNWLSEDVLRPYTKSAEVLEVAANAALKVTVPIQDAH